MIVAYMLQMLLQLIKIVFLIFLVNLCDHNFTGLQIQD
jgi:hypothetical protein